MIKQIPPKLIQSLKRFERFYAPLTRLKLDNTMLLQGAILACCAFVFVFTLITFLVAEKPYRLFEPTAMLMPKTADLADIKNAKALMAVFVSDVGLNSKVVQALGGNETPAYTIALSAYAATPTETIATISHRGYEMWLQAAIDSARSGYEPGPMALRSDNNVKENWDMLMRQLSPSASYVRGLLVPFDAALPFATQSWKDLAEQILAKGLLVVDATPAQIPPSLYMAQTQSAYSAYMKADVVLDASGGLEQLSAGLAAAAQKALAKKQLLVTLINPNPKAVQLVSKQLLALEKTGIAIVPASVLLTRGVTAK